jgi:hypothetical protein
MAVNGGVRRTEQRRENADIFHNYLYGTLHLDPQLRRDNTSSLGSLPTNSRLSLPSSYMLLPSYC